MVNKEKICVYTCITGNYDELQEFEIKEKNIDYLCFTNNKFLKSDFWQIIYIEDDKLDNHMLSRKIKMLGHPIIDEKYDISVWVDADIFFKKKVSDFIKDNLKGKPFASFRHHERDCIYDEAKKCIELRKDSKEKILETVKFLKKENFPEHYGLNEMTVFIKKHNDKVVRKTMKLWFEMISKYSKRDQLSFMYSVWKTGLEISYIDLNVWDNDYFGYVRHNYDKKNEKCRIYYGNIENFDYNLNEELLYKKKGHKYQIETKVLNDTNLIRVDLTKTPCVIYKNLDIRCDNIENIEIIDSIFYNGNNVFYSPKGIVYLHGIFNKNNKLKITVEFDKMNEAEVIDFLIYECKKNKELQDKVNLLDTNINNIINSKSWKITKPLRKITNLKRK